MTAFHTFLNALTRASVLDGVLGESLVEFPLTEDAGSWATPKNAVLFGWMGVNMVHYVILKIDDQICDHSPVIQVSPTSSEEPYSLLAPTFLDFLATGCGCDRKTIEDLIEAENSGRPALIDFMRSNFTDSHFFNGIDRPIGSYRTMIVPP